MPSPRAMKSHTNYSMMPGGEPAKSMLLGTQRMWRCHCSTMLVECSFSNSQETGIVSLSILSMVKQRAAYGMIMC